MFKILLKIIIFCHYVSIYAGTTPFITTWQTSIANESVTIPTTPPFLGFTYNYTVDWGDGSTVTMETGDATHIYAVAGNYTVSILGDFPRIYFNNSGDKDKILTIEQWGDNQWASMSAAFEGCIYLNIINTSIDTPNLSNVTDMRYMFSFTEAFNADINNWNVSNVTDMSFMFENATSFNSDIGDWDVSNVINMSSMFKDAVEFNADIGDWDVSSVTNMTKMFTNAVKFNGDINDWDVSSVDSMSFLFENAISFNADIGDWDVSNVTNMYGVFSDAVSFNADIGDWDVSNVIDMKSMFRDAISFNADIGDWDVSGVINMSQMFRGAINFNQDPGNWNVSSVTDMASMFRDAILFNQDVGGWDVSGVKEMGAMFLGATLSIDNYDALLIGWNAQDLQANIRFSAGNSMYCLGTSARTNMIINDGWNITEDGGRLLGPILNELEDQPINDEINSYVFPRITGLGLTGNEGYYTDVNGLGIKYTEGDIITYNSSETYPINIYIYDGSGICPAETFFKLILTKSCSSPVVDTLKDSNECTSYILPVLSVGNNYYTNSDGTGVTLKAGDTITTSQTIYIYTGTTGCSNESSFTVTILDAPVVDLPNQSSSVDINSFVFPEIIGENLTGEEAYYRGNGGKGSSYISGDVLFYDEKETYPLTLYVYDELGTCSSEESFEIILVEGDICIQPIADLLFDETACNEFVLPNLSIDNYYYTRSGALGSQLFEGDVITNSQQIYIYTGDETRCFDETSFFILIENCEDTTPIIPGFFTPNGDGINDLLVANNVNDLKGFVFVYDRFGKLLHQFDIKLGGWDGVFEGRDMPTNTYWYLLKTSDKEIKGYFLLKR